MIERSLILMGHQKKQTFPVKISIFQEKLKEEERERERERERRSGVSGWVVCMRCMSFESLRRKASEEEGSRFFQSLPALNQFPAFFLRGMKREEEKRHKSPELHTY